MRRRSSDPYPKGDPLVAGIALVVPIEGGFGFDAAHAMLARLESRQVAGKLLLQVTG